LKTLSALPVNTYLEYFGEIIPIVYELGGKTAIRSILKIVQDELSQ
jgi:hypothetical protein